MEEFENYDEYDLRELLVREIEEARGRDYLMGWLKSVYRNGYMKIDTDRDMLIAEIRDYRNRKSATIGV